MKTQLGGGRDGIQTQAAWLESILCYSHVGMNILFVYPHLLVLFLVLW